MRRLLTLAAAAVIAANSVAAQDPVAPPAAIAAARAAMNDTVRGAELQVALLTAGYGTDAIWDHFGHSIIWIRNVRTNESTLWNWGLFDFDEPGFVKRFLFGNTRYWMEGTPESWLNGYRRRNREVVSQELALTPGQRAALDAFVRANATEENKFYRYDYFIDNCSTRIRDALDIILDGALRRAMDTPPEGPHTYRSETLRLVQSAPWYFLGMDLALGVPADKTLNPWTFSFIPMRLHDALELVTVPGPNGTTVPLVASERTLVTTTRPPLPADYTGTTSPRWVLLGAVLLSIALVLLGKAGARGNTVAWVSAVTLGILVHVAFGLLSSLIVFMWLFTKHTFWAWNHHLLLFTPLSLLIAVLLPFLRGRLERRRLIGLYHFLVVIAAAVLLVGTIVKYGGRPSQGAQLFLVWAATSLILHAAVGAGVVRRRQ